MNAPGQHFRFSKKEKLTHKRYIKELFTNGSFFHVRPIQLKYLAKSNLDTHQILVAVPKRYIKKAVTRNLIKRRIREAYRLNKHLLPQDSYYLIAIIYLSADVVNFDEIQQKLIKGLQRLERSTKKAED